MSIYLISLERRLDTSNPRIVNYLKYIEKVGLKLPDLLILDTPQYVQWFAKTYGISPDRFALVPTGADDRVFQPHKHKLNNGIDDFIQEDSIRILYYGSYIPNHDVKSIIEAAFILRREKYKFVLIGEGPEREEAQKLAENKNLENVEFIDWLEKNELLHQIDRADIILGAFGETPQSLMTIQNKIFEGMAMCKPVVTGRSEAVQAVFRHNESIYLCNRHDPISLADAIRTLSEHASLRRSIAQNGNRIFKENFSVSVLGCKYKTHIRKLIDN